MTWRDVQDRPQALSVFPRGFIVGLGGVVCAVVGFRDTMGGGNGNHRRCNSRL